MASDLPVPATEHLARLSKADQEALLHRRTHAILAALLVAETPEAAVRLRPFAASLADLAATSGSAARR